MCMRFANLVLVVLIASIDCWCIELCLMIIMNYSDLGKLYGFIRNRLSLIMLKVKPKMDFVGEMA